LEVIPFRMGLHVKLEQPPFDRFVIGLHVHHLKCMYSFEHGLDDMTPFHELKGYWIWLFLFQGCAFS
jgi:hypothetical protein